jgi:ankyrin repeat protein
MSDSLDFEELRKQAKTVLKQCRAGDPKAIDRMRAQLPRLRALDIAQIASQIKLGDVHHALARELGYRNWAGLKLQDEPVVRFLAAIRGGALDAASAELRRSPSLAHDSIHAACAIGDSDAVAHHLDLDSNLLTAEEGGWPPLMYACGTPFHRLSLRHAFSIHECASLLLDRGADPNTSTLTTPSDPGSRVPAMVRAGLNNNRLVFLLLNQRGATASGDAVKAVKQTFARMDPQQNPLGQTYLNLVEDPGFREEVNRRLAALRAGRPQTSPVPAAPPQMSIKGMLELDRNIDRMTRDFNLTAWQLALERGIDPNSRSGPSGETALHRFAMRKDDTSKAVAELFLTHGADPNVATVDGRTAYAVAVRMGNKPMMDLLLAHGAKPESASPADQFIGACRRADGAAAWTALRSEPELLKVIGPECDELLMGAIKNNQPDAVRLMANLGFDLTALGGLGATALHIAAWHAYVEMVRLLLEFHVPVNSRDLVYGTAPLAWAVHGSKSSKSWREGHDNDYCAVVEALINAGADYESSCNPSGARPDGIASGPVLDLLKARGFVRGKG